MKQVSRDLSYLMFQSNHLHPENKNTLPKKVIYLFHVWTPPPKEADKVDWRCGCSS
jgi:hypothetical protein